jgi:threonine-phosphate decarboxylase
MLEGHGDDLYRYHAIKANFSSNVLFGELDKDLAAHLRQRIGSVTHYPEAGADKVQAAAAKAFGVDADQVLVTNGATEAIYLTAQTFRREVAAAVVAGPTFIEYRDACHLNGIGIIFTEWNDIKEFGYDIAGLFYICNPNNPSGEAMALERLLYLIGNNPGTLFVIDESYIEFTLAAKSVIPFLREFPNMIILRSLTKSCRIPGLRLGFAVGNAANVAQLRQNRMPWSVNQLAIEAGLYIFQHRQDFAVPVRPLLAATSIWQEALRTATGWRIFDTDTHFFLVETPENFTAADLKQHLIRNHGLLIRDAENFGLNPRYFRVACQSPQDNELLTEALYECARTGL